MKVKFVVLGDLHFPWHSKAALTAALEFIRDHQPRYVVQVGDLYDMWSMSRWPKAQNEIDMTPGQEMLQGRMCAEEMWKIIRKWSPESKCIQLCGNHDIRLRQKLMSQLPELLGTDIVDLKSLFKFKGVKTYFSDREEVEIEGLIFMHGYLSGSPEKAPHAKHNLQSTWVGHSHKGGVVHYTHKNKKVIYEANAGLLGDISTKCLQYTRQKWVNWQLGWGVVDEWGPRFIPWVGK